VSDTGPPLPAVVTSPVEMQHWSDSARKRGRRVAVVPTMGALHEGHLSLIRKANGEADLVIVTLFVNPTQFGPGEDFERYPRAFAGDVALAGDAGAAYVFAPAAEDMYPAGYQTFISVEEITRTLEGAIRPGHFRGVATIVAKLFNCTHPHMAFFGQKDAQQVAVITRMVQDLNFDVQIIVCPTVREADGLAKSSRNVYLTAGQRAEAPVLYRSLVRAKEMVAAGETSADHVRSAARTMITTESSGIIDYVSVAHAESLEELTDIGAGVPVTVSLAVRFGSTRLIDNIQTQLGHA
jgi:pantoate--beta-alanine ligase